MVVDISRRAKVRWIIVLVYTVYQTSGNPAQYSFFFSWEIRKNSREIQKDDGRQIVVFSIY